MKRFLLLATLLGCDASRDFEVHSSAVSGGSADHTHSSVGYLVQDNRCSATLIAPRLVLTARHCVADEDQVVPLTGLKREPQSVRQTTVRWDFQDGRLLKVSGSVIRHLTKDLALIALDQRVDFIEPSVIGTEVPVVGDTITAIGFGFSQGTDGWGTRRQGSWALSRADNDALEYVGPGGICRGDSGGPSFVGRLVVGVHSYAGIPCGTISGDVPVAPEMGWINATAREWGPNGERADERAGNLPTVVEPREEIIVWSPKKPGICTLPTGGLCP